MSLGFDMPLKCGALNKHYCWYTDSSATHHLVYTDLGATHHLTGELNKQYCWFPSIPHIDMSRYFFLCQ
jgi:hypothetical protein